jgi:hypothetical protein
MVKIISYYIDFRGFKLWIHTGLVSALEIQIRYEICKVQEF